MGLCIPPHQSLQERLQENIIRLALCARMYIYIYIHIYIYIYIYMYHVFGHVVVIFAASPSLMMEVAPRPPTRQWAVGLRLPAHCFGINRGVWMERRQICSKRRHTHIKIIYLTAHIAYFIIFPLRRSLSYFSSGIRSPVSVRLGITTTHRSSIGLGLN